MDIILHAGPHKTGTTAIQLALWMARERLLEEEGLLYPVACRYHYAQHRLAFALKGQRDPDTGEVPDPEGEIDALLEEIASARPRRVVISSEELIAVPAQQVAYLIQALGRAEGARIGLLATLRHPLDLLRSMYNQNVKAVGNGFVRPLREVMERPVKMFPVLDMSQRLQRWEEVLGNDRIRLLHYEAGDMLGQMSRALDLARPLGPQGGPVNESVHPKAAEMVRLSKLAGLPIEARRRIAAFASERFPPQRGAAARVRPKEARALMAALAPGYERLFRDYLGVESPYTVASLQERLGRREDTLTPAELVRLLAEERRLVEMADAP